jgi:4-hydroxy-3-methylbut-2-en-1-yl diphosphate synthase IspG/GcpE
MYHKREAYTTTAHLYIDAEDITWVVYAGEVNITVEDMKNIFSVMERLMQGKRMPVMVDARASYTIDQEARTLAAANTRVYPATAIITNNIMNKYLSDLYAKLHTAPSSPIRVFLNEGKALEWLRGFIQQPL